MATRPERPLAELVERLPFLDDRFEEDSVLEYIDDSTSVPPGAMLKMTADGQLKTGHDQEPLKDLVYGFPSPDHFYEVDSSLDCGDSSSVMLQQSTFAREIHNQVEADFSQMPPVDFVSDTTMLDNMFGEDSTLEELNCPTFTSSQPIPCTTKAYGNVDEAYFSYPSTWQGGSWLASEDTTYGSYYSTSSVAPKQACATPISSDLITSYVDPKLTSPPTESALSALIAEQRRSNSGLAAPFTAEDLQPEEDMSLGQNDFDAALTEFTTLPIHASNLPPNVSQAGLGWLDQWLKQNQSHLPSQKELQCLEGLTNLPGAFITNWLIQHSTTNIHLPKEENSSSPRVTIPSNTHQKTSAYLSSSSSSSPPSRSSRPRQKPTPHPQPPPSITCSSHPHPYHPKIKPTTTTSSSTNPPAPPQLPSTHNPPPAPLYTCTLACGFSTPRRHDWSRHERKRFEEWICPLPSCSASLSRKEKLRGHLRVVHGRPAPSAKELDPCRREKEGAGRVCGFCGEGFEEWKTWLGHVGDHFERGDKKR